MIIKKPMCFPMWGQLGTESEPTWASLGPTSFLFLQYVLTSKWSNIGRCLQDLIYTNRSWVGRVSPLKGS